MRDQLPHRWLEILAASNFSCSSCLDASAEVMRREVDAYREELLDIEDLARNAIAGQQNDALGDALQRLVALNEEWIERQNDALRVLSGSHDQLGQYAVLGHQLETILLDQTSLIQTECADLVSVDEEDVAAYDSIIGSIGKLVDMMHELRDVLHSASLMTLCSEGWLDASDRPIEQDELTGLQNCLGVEQLLEHWWQADEQRKRLVCAALLDIDRFGDLNRQVGTRLGDRMLHTVAVYLDQLVASENGLERVFRYAGQRFFIFFGDVGQRTAASTIEKIRQSIEAIRLEYDGQQYALTIRAGVTEVQQDDDTATLVQRLAMLADAAKHAGRNRIAIDGSSGSEIIQPEPLEIKRRVIKVG